MKEELEKMSKEGIENIILDLRGNGGGSLRGCGSNCRIVY
jgi:C-terminal processing protease CtpA/Prc